MNKKPATVYRLFDEAGELLYIGCSTDPFQRIATHRSGTPWWFAVASVRMEHFDDKATALNEESIAIKSEKPKYNLRVLEPMPRWLVDKIQEDRAKSAEERVEAHRAARMYRVPGLRCNNCGWTGGWVKKGVTPAEVKCPQCDVKALVADPERSVA